MNSRLRGGVGLMLVAAFVVGCATTGAVDADRQRLAAAAAVLADTTVTVPDRMPRIAAPETETELLALPVAALPDSVFMTPAEAEAYFAAREAALARPLGAGRASYYGRRFAGRRTASGERFNPRRMTAAHRTLPFGARVRVTNVKNGRHVVVRINDRGPFSGHRVIDLSYAAAQELGMIRSGTARVELELLPEE